MTKCFRCGGSYLRLGEVVSCLQCGHEPAPADDPVVRAALIAEQEKRPATRIRRTLQLAMDL